MSLNNESLISIDEIISRAKKLGVDFGKGNPRERLRYLTKIGLLPHAKRKSFNGETPNGAYPEFVLGRLVEIDKKIKAGKSIQQIKREEERRDLIQAPSKIEIPKIEKEFPLQPKLFFRAKTQTSLETEKPIKLYSRINKKLVLSLIITSLILILGGIFLFQRDGIENLYSSLLASLNWAKKLVQAPAIPVKEKAEVEETFFFPSLEPYLTINAETEINAPLNVKEEITAPSLAFLKREFKATLLSADLTANRTYTFPNLSGTVCLTTGNCIGLGGEVFAPEKGITNRLAKFISDQEIGVSSIEDFYSGVALTIDSKGRVGVGISEPKYDLHVMGKIQATGDICTDLKGGKCLSELTTAATPIFIGGGGVGGSGSANYLPLWTANTTLGNSIISQSDSIIEVTGRVKMSSFQLTTGAASGYILTSDASGIGTWQPAPTGTLPVGISGQTLRHNGTDWVANSFLYNTGAAIGIGTTSTPATLTLSGNAVFTTTTLPQLVLKYDDNNYFKISVSSGGTVLFDSVSGKIQAATGSVFYTAQGNPIRESGEEILRAAIPIFRYDYPAQTASTSYVRISKHFASTSEISLPDAMEGTTRVYRLAIKYADDIATSSYSDWRVVNQAHTNVYSTTTLPGRNMNTFEEGEPYITDLITIPNNDWQVEVKVPSGKVIRIFNIFLLAFDKIN